MKSIRTTVLQLLVLVVGLAVWNVVGGILKFGPSYLIVLITTCSYMHLHMDYKYIHYAVFLFIRNVAIFFIIKHSKTLSSSLIFLYLMVEEKVWLLFAKGKSPIVDLIAVLCKSFSLLELGAYYFFKNSFY